MLRKELYKNMSKYYITKRAQKERWRKRTGSGQYEAKPWTEDEDQLVLAHKTTDRILSERIRRSVTSIYDRRAQLKRRKGDGTHK